MMCYHVGVFFNANVVRPAMLILTQIGGLLLGLGQLVLGLPKNHTGDQVNASIDSRSFQPHQPKLDHAFDYGSPMPL